MNGLYVPKRHPIVPERSQALSEEQHGIQIKKGLYTRQGGAPFALPVDDMKKPRVFLNKDMWRLDPVHGVYRPGVRFQPFRMGIQKKVLEFLRDRVNSNIPYWYYMATLGHDLHVGTWGELYAKQWHHDWANPFNPEELVGPLDPTYETADHPGYLKSLRLVGFVENLGMLSSGKVTDAFVSEEIAELVSAASSEYADYDFHEVGLGTTAENNNDTAIETTTGIARATGSPTDSDPIYQNVGTVTADATETWEEWGLFNNLTSVSLMDRSLTGGQAVNSSDQVQYTYQLTKNPEA